jgi:uncharacterized repeat protein (TIGR01451 family)
MRHLSIVLCASVALCGHAPLADAGTTNPPLTFTLDLLGPCTASGCSGIHPTDISLNLEADSFVYTTGTGSASGAFVANMAVNSPVVCDEIASTGTLGASTPLRLAPAFTNAAPGGLLEFNGGGPSIVDLQGVSFDGVSPAGIAATYSNYGATLPPQVVCYQINPISGGPVAVAAGPYGIFASSFEAGHLSSEPWVSVQTVSSPAPAGQHKPSNQINSAPQPNDLVYVVQVHNALSAIGWHLSFGYDSAFFDPANNGTVAPQWCVLSSAQPGIPSSCSSGGSMTLPPGYTLQSGDIQSATNSVYLQVVMAGSSAATGTGGWSALTGASYPSAAAIFPKFGTYPQRFDDKIAVASANNLPTLNIGSIVCNNDTVSTACVITDPDGNAVPAAVTFHNTISGAGTANIDPLAYFVDPTAGTTLPGNAAADALSVSAVSCTGPDGNPSPIFSSPITAANFTTSTNTPLGGAKALGFSFAPSGSQNFPYVAGTANCTATFTTTANYSPALALTGLFTITMNQAAVGSVQVTAPAGPAAPAGNLTYTVVVANAGSSTLANVLATDNQADATFSVSSWTCTGTGATCPHASGTGALAETIPSLPAGGSLTYLVSGVVGPIVTNPVASVTNSASINVPGGSCAAGLCSGSASVATVPIIGVQKTASELTYHTADAVTYTVVLSNQGGTAATGLTLADAVPSGIAFVSWTCTPVGTNSSCPTGSGGALDINESSISVDAGGSVTYSVQATVTSIGGLVTNTATASTLNGGAVCIGTCSASASMTLASP